MSGPFSVSKRIKDLGSQSTQRDGTATVVGRAAGATSGRSSTVEMLSLELAEEQQAIKDYSAQIAEIIKDNETITLLEKDLLDEMEHARWLKGQILTLKKRE